MTKRKAQRLAIAATARLKRLYGLNDILMIRHEKAGWVVEIPPDLMFPEIVELIENGGSAC